MPFVNQSGNQTVAVLIGAGGVGAEASVAAQFRARLNGNSQIEANLTSALESSATLIGSSAIEAFGRLNDDPNVFGAALMGGESYLSPNGKLVLDARAVLRGEANFTPNVRTAESETATLNLFVSIADDSTRSFSKTYSARIFADNISYPIKSFSYSEADSSAGSELQVELARTSNRAALLAANSIKFEIYDGAGWREIFSAGKRRGAGFSIGFGNGRGNDNLSISTAAPTAEKLEKSPERPFVLYDSTRLNLNASDFEILRDTEGVSYPVELRGVANLDLKKALEIIFVEKCGFASVKTNLPNFKIRRIDASMTDSFLDSIAGHLGVFNPLFFVRGDVLWILDSETSLPSGMPAPLELQSSDYRSFVISDSELNADGYILQFAQDETDFDYYTERFETPPPDETGNFGDADYTQTTIERRWRDYFKESNPLTPVKTEKVFERTEVHNGANLISRESENFTFDSLARLVKILKVSEARIPDIANAPEDFTFDTVRRETTQFSYKADPKFPRRQILGQTTRQVRGLIAVDSSNKFLGQDFRQEFQTANRSGNLAEGQTLEFGAIETMTETAAVGKNGTVEMRVRTVDHLRQAVTNSVTESRQGDISINAQTSEAKQTIVLRVGAVRTNAKLQTLSVGELPLNLAKSLARRKLGKRKIQTGNLTLLGLNLAVRRGTVLEVFNRAENSEGAFLVEGLSISGANLGTREQQTVQTLNLKRI